MALPNTISGDETDQTLNGTAFDDDIEGGGSDRLIEAVIPWGDAGRIAERVRAHLDAGADHVCVQVVADYFTFPLAEYRELAPALSAG